MDNALFRAAFPEFADIVRYPDAMLAFWSSFAVIQVDPCRWGTQVNMGIYLYVAHEITLAAQNQKAGVVGGTPGASGLANSKTVGSVTVAYDTTSTSEKDAGYWNLTNYGKQFIRLARIFGSGCVQL
jgi:hypothetical protein